MKIFLPLVPQLHWGLFTENSCGVDHSENGASLYLNDIELRIIETERIMQRSCFDDKIIKKG